MIGEIFTLVLLNPLVNLLVLLSHGLFGSFGAAIIAFTLLIRAVTFPLTLRQIHATRTMQALQPRISEVNKKYSDPKRRQEEVMKLYREAGANPLSCIGPFFLQIPVFIALYSAIRIALPNSPEALEKLSGHIYSWSYLQHALPLSERFLGIDLRSNGDASIAGYVFVVLVGLTTWAQSKTTITTATDDKARAQQQMMNVMLPLMFAFFALSFPLGVSLYWVVNSVAQIAFNILTYGLPAFGIEPVVKARTAPLALSAAAPAPEAAAPTSARELRTANGSGRSKRQNRRRRPE
ncbi:MAG: membrane protein insertase YidC [Dehalococcoidia bacterium]|nr:membrane protein insertase YidC [Dehalococcoidia bacterium]